MGMLYKRGAVWWIKYYRNGRGMRESSHSTKERAAKRLLKVREGDIERGLPVDPKLNRIRFDEAAEDRQADVIVSGEGDDRKERRFSNGEINRELTTLKRIFNLARQNGKLTYMPHIPMLKERNARTGFFEREQIERVLGHLPAAVRPAVQLAYITGWRIPSEVLPLQWRQIDFEASVLRLDPHTTKNDEGRTFPFTDVLRRLLEAQKAGHDHLRAEGVLCPWVFHRSGKKVKGKPIVRFTKAWRKACGRRVVPAAFRMTFDERPYGISCVLEFPNASRCR